MTIVTTQYVRKPFYIDAVQVTEENIEEVAQWCNGILHFDEKKEMYIQVRVHRPMNERQTKAYAGDWVLYAGTGYKVYSPKAFNNSFQKVVGEQADAKAQEEKPKSLPGDPYEKAGIPKPGPQNG